MAKFGEQLASGSRSLFWGIVPLGTFLMLRLNMSIEWNRMRAWIVGTLDLAFFLLAIGLYNPKKFSWALRLLMALVFVAYCIFAVTAIFFLPEHRWIEPSLGLIVIGIPALFYAIRGFAALEEKPDQSSRYHPGPIDPE